MLDEAKRILGEEYRQPVGPAAESDLTDLLTHLRAVRWAHLAAHWVAEGDEYYGDHLLYERLYEGVEGEVDKLAEKLVVLFGGEAVDPVRQAFHVRNHLDRFDLNGGFEGEPAAELLEIERRLLEDVQLTYESLEATGNLSMGLDNALQAIADAHEEHLYLLQRRARGGE